MTFWVGPVLIVLCDLLPVARWWSMGFWSVHPHPSGCSPLDACLSRWFSTVSLSCLRWYMTQNTVRSWLTTVNLRYKMDPGGVGRPIWHVAGQEPARMMNGGSCEDSVINLQVDYISRLQNMLPPEKAIWVLFNSTSHKHQLHLIFSVWWRRWRQHSGCCLFFPFF